MADIKWNVQAAVAGGPSLNLNQPAVTVDAYDSVQVALPDGASGVAVGIAVGSGKVGMVIISSDQYGANLSYTVDGGSSNVLDGPHVFIGSGAVSFLHPGGTPSSLSFSNTLGKTANLSILVGRNLT